MRKINDDIRVIGTLCADVLDGKLSDACKAQISECVGVEAATRDTRLEELSERVDKLQEQVDSLVNIAAELSEQANKPMIL